MPPATCACYEKNAAAVLDPSLREILLQVGHYAMGAPVRNAASDWTFFLINVASEASVLLEMISMNISVLRT
jgi:hypothetical protein